jgi:hypothetical protein
MGAVKKFLTFETVEGAVYFLKNEFTKHHGYEPNTLLLSPFNESRLNGELKIKWHDGLVGRVLQFEGMDLVIVDDVDDDFLKLGTRSTRDGEVG